MSKWTHRECFNHFGVSPRNVQWSWSARDGSKVVHTLWADGFRRSGDSTIYEKLHKPPEGSSSAAYNELCENMLYALEHCGGMLNVIMARVKNPTVWPLKIASCWPVDWKMKIREWNPDTGYLLCEQVR
jgi:hypothetical protein